MAEKDALKSRKSRFCFIMDILKEYHSNIEQFPTRNTGHISITVDTDILRKY